MNFRYLFARLQEASTWRGLAMIATGLGVAAAPEKIEAVVSLGTIVAGLFGALTTDGSTNKQL